MAECALTRTIGTKLWEMLPARRRQGLGWEPAAPLILAALYETSDSQKRERFHSHIRWANAQGALDEIASFIFSLKSANWHKGT
jgi:hypothetical protein